MSNIMSRTYVHGFRGVFSLAVLTICCAVFYSEVSAGEGEPVEKKPSPHGVDGSCLVCHVEPEDVLTGWFVSGARKRSLKRDFNSLCRDCHGVNFGHGVGETPRVNKADLPMDNDGRITCAITCHNMHVKAEDYKQQRYHLRLTTGQLCASCHSK